MTGPPSFSYLHKLNDLGVQNAYLLKLHDFK
jgi:hypothetical protein